MWYTLCVWVCFSSFAIFVNRYCNTELILHVLKLTSKLKLLTALGITHRCHTTSSFSDAAASSPCGSLAHTFADYEYGTRFIHIGISIINTIVSIHNHACVFAARSGWTPPPPLLQLFFVFSSRARVCVCVCYFPPHAQKASANYSLFAVERSHNATRQRHCCRT